MYGIVYIRCTACLRDRGVISERFDAETEARVIAAQVAGTLTDATVLFSNDELPENFRCTYPSCSDLRHDPPASGRYFYRYRNAQVDVSEAAAIALHPSTGEVVYCFANPGDPLPERYAKLGFEKQQFHSLHGLRQFCKARGLVNDIEYDSKYDGMTEESARTREQWEREKAQKYERERALAARALEEERRQRRRSRSR